MKCLAFPLFAGPVLLATAAQPELDARAPAGLRLPVLVIGVAEVRYVPVDPPEEILMPALEENEPAPARRSADELAPPVILRAPLPAPER